MLLGVNIDHVATLRQARGGISPSPVEFAGLAISAGADNITIHLRQDFRHIQKKDMLDLARFKLNVEIAVDDAHLLDFVIKNKPYSICLVPENPNERTTGGGLDLSNPKLPPVISKIKQAGILVSLFIEPDPSMIARVVEIGAEKIEIYTGRYAYTGEGLDDIRKIADEAEKTGLKVSAGHGLNYENVSAIAKIFSIYELNIGHSIVSRAVMVGAMTAVREMKNLIAR